MRRPKEGLREAAQLTTGKQRPGIEQEPNMSLDFHQRYCPQAQLLAVALHKRQQQRRAVNSESMPERAGAVPVFPVSESGLQDPELPVCEVGSMTCVFCGASKVLDTLGTKALGQHGAKVSDSSIYSA